MGYGLSGAWYHVAQAILIVRARRGSLNCGKYVCVFRGFTIPNMQVLQLFPNSLAKLRRSSNSRVFPRVPLDRSHYLYPR